MKAIANSGRGTAVYQRPAPREPLHSTARSRAAQPPIRGRPDRQQFFRCCFRLQVWRDTRQPRLLQTGRRAGCPATLKKRITSIRAPRGAAPCDFSDEPYRDHVVRNVFWLQGSLDCASYIWIGSECHQACDNKAREDLHTRPKDCHGISEPEPDLVPHRCNFPIVDQIYLRAMTSRLAASAAIFRAFDFTSATRRLQPRPKTGQALSDWRKCSRSSQIAAIKVLGSIARAAATTSLVTTLVLSDSLRVRRSTLPLRPMPEFTP